MSLTGSLGRKLLLIVALLLGPFVADVPAQSEEPPAPPLPMPTASSGESGSSSPADSADQSSGESPLVGKTEQIGDEPLQEFEPRTPRTEEDENVKEAVVHYMTGRIQQERGLIDDAWESYQQAIALDPQGIEPYRSGVQLLVRMGKSQEARDTALAAARHNEKGFLLLMGMAAVSVRQNQLDQSIELMQRGLEIPGLEPDSLYALLLHRDLGIYYRLKEDYESAAKEFQVVFSAITQDDLSEETRTVLLANPGEFYDEFGEVFLKAKMPDLAIQAFEEAAKHREAKPGLHSYNLATVYQQAGENEKALQQLNEYFTAQLQTRGREAYDLLKTLLKDLGREDELLPKLEAMYETDSHNDVLRFYLADEVLAQGDVDRAEELYLQGADTPTDPRALVGMISIYRQQKNAEKLLQTVTMAFQTVPRPDDDESLRQLSPDVRDLSEHFSAALEALEKDNEMLTALFDAGRQLSEKEEPSLEFFQAYVLGKIAIDADRTEDAETFYRYAISMRNDPPAQLYSELGAHLLDTEHYEEAVELLTEAINHPSSMLRQDKWRFLFFLSYAYEFLGDTDQALDAIRQARRLSPNIPQLHYQEAWVVYHAHRWDEALEIFEAVIRENPGDKKLIQDCRFRISNIYVEQDDMEKGEAVLQEVLKDDPENTQANNDLGYLWADQDKNLEQAEKMIRKAVAAEPENPAYLDSLGWVLYRSGDYEQAAEELHKATQLKHGDDSTIFDHLGDALLKLDRHDEAREVFQTALEKEEAKNVPSEELLGKIREKLEQLK